ncbi:hypothetical protein P167DRAFT_378762 [Morchella conica CCBAS932]|uniref:Uncharacterized protein n=1 Tax=Morchella conica CCBAS932 TaxID=1392247 RepID=A0A3N4L2R8_9PEZI|nr:hypothetical protein P167DRAFT_378762 [Morchella conica CCBAS932]
MSLALMTNCWKYHPQLPTIYIDMINFKGLIGICLSRLRKVRYAYYLRHLTSQYFIIDVCGQDIKLFRIHTTDIMDINVFATLFGLFLERAGEIGLRIDLRGRESSSDHIVTQGPGIRSLHAMDMA